MQTQVKEGERKRKEEWKSGGEKHDRRRGKREEKMKTKRSEEKETEFA